MAAASPSQTQGQANSRAPALGAPYRLPHGPGPTRPHDRPKSPACPSPLSQLPGLCPICPTAGPSPLGSPGSPGAAASTCGLCELQGSVCKQAVLENHLPTLQLLVNRVCPAPPWVTSSFQVARFASVNGWEWGPRGAKFPQNSGVKSRASDQEHSEGVHPPTRRSSAPSFRVAPRAAQSSPDGTSCKWSSLSVPVTNSCFPSVWGWLVPVPQGPRVAPGLGFTYPHGDRPTWN